MKTSYLTRFEKYGDLLPGGKNVQEFRREAIGLLKKLPFPTVKEEEWRNTTLKAYEEQEFMPFKGDENTVSIVDWESFSLPDFDCFSVVFGNGLFLPSLSQLPSDGIEVVSIRDLVKGKELPKELCSFPSNQKENFFALLNSAFFEDGVFIKLKEGVKMEKPIYLIYLTNTGDLPVSFHPRNIIVAEKGSQLSLVEQYLGSSICSYLMNPTTSFFLKEGAEVEHCGILNEGENSLHLGHMFLNQQPKSRFISNTFQVKGRLTRREIYIDIEEKAESTVNGLYLGNEEEHRDFFIRAEHNKPGGKSNQLFKGVLQGKSHGVFNGKITVQQDAQRIEAHQTNKNLLLSEESVADTRPQLEIYADDVKCTHGATVGQLDEEALFYLKSRGIDEKAAQDILTTAFAREIVDGVALESVRSYLEKQLFR